MTNNWENDVNKSLLTALLATLLIGSLALVGNINFNTIKGDTQVTGIISSDTTWTEANSPYNLTGNVLVNNGVTLAIQ
jgi:hypothetical protein